MRRLQRPGVPDASGRDVVPPAVGADARRDRAHAPLQSALHDVPHVGAEPGHELSIPEVRRILGQMPHLNWLDLTGGELFLRKDAVELIEAVCEVPSLGVLHFPTNGWFGARIVEAARARPGAAARHRPPDHREPRRTARPARSDPRPRRMLRAGDRDVPAAARHRFRSDLRRHDHHPRQRRRHRRPRSGAEAADSGFPCRRVALELDADLGALLSQRAPRQDRRARPRARWSAATSGAAGVPHNLVDAMELAFLVNLEFYQRGEPTGIVCQALRSTAFISPEGDLYPCHVYDRPLGNLRERSLDEIWNSPEVLEARRDIEKLACGGCFTPCEAYPALAGAPGRGGGADRPARAAPALRTASGRRRGPKRNRCRLAMTDRRTRVSVVLPAYNEERTIAAVVRGCRAAAAAAERDHRRRRRLHRCAPPPAPRPPARG